MSDIEYDSLDHSAPPRLYTAAEVALERAALLREAAAYCLNRAKQLSLYRKEYNPAEVKEIERLKFAETQLEIRSDEILAIPTDQSALTKHNQEISKAAEEALAAELGKYLASAEWGMIHQVIHKLTTVAGGSLARVEAAAYERAKRNAAMECDKKDKLPSEIQRRILALEDRGREAEK